MHQKKISTFLRKRKFWFSQTFSERIRSYDEEERLSPATAGAENAPRGKMFDKTKRQLRYFSYSIPLVCIMFAFSILSHQQCFAATSATLSINNPTLSASASAGGLAYASTNVTVSASEIEDYSLTISGPTNLGNNTTTLGGANGKTPAAMASNSWGYAWDSTGSGFANDTATYNSFSPSGTRLTGSAVANNATNFTRKLAFAAKFGTDADGGHYKTNVTLSLAVTPQGVITLNNISNMQQMTPEICAASAVGTTATLTDTRDNNTYTVRKHEDNNCWMTQNLRLVGSKTLTPADSNVTANYILPASDASKFSSSSYTNPIASATYYANNVTYGTYYSRPAAVADNTTYLPYGTEVNTSICPKGWFLPSASDHYTMISKVGTLLKDEPYNYQPAGYFDASKRTLTGNNTAGYYLSRTLNNDTYLNTDFAAMNFTKTGSTISAIKQQSPNHGYTMRCVAYNQATRPYTYNITIKDEYNTTLPNYSYTITSTSETYVVILPNSLLESNGELCSINSWRDDSGASYSGYNQSLILTPSKPSVTITAKGHDGVCEI